MLNNYRITRVGGMHVAEYKDGTTICLEFAIADANRELDLVKNRGRVKEEFIIRCKIKDLVRMWPRSFSLLDDGKAIVRDGRIWRPTDPRLTPSSVDEDRAVLADLGVKLGKATPPKKYRLKGPKNPHRGEYVRAKKGVRNSGEFWATVLQGRYRNKGPAKTHYCVLNCGKHISQTHGMCKKCSDKTRRDVTMVDRGVMKESELHPLIREYYEARKVYRGLKLVAWFNGRKDRW